MSNKKTRIGFVYNSQVPEASELTDSLIGSLSLGDLAWSVAADAVAELGQDLSETSLVVTVGGDGTILRTVRATAAHDVPILSVNLGKVGFMSELEVPAALSGISRLINGQADESWIDDRIMVRAEVKLVSGTEVPVADALNEVVLSRGQSAKLLRVEAIVDDAELTTYRADGVLVSTATGSTGYAMAAGGPLINPGSEDMLLLPIAPHMCLNTGLVLPGQSVVDLKVKNAADTLLSIDGVPVADLGPGDVVRIIQSPYKAHFIRLQARKHFYSTLTRRLGILDRA